MRQKGHGIFKCPSNSNSVPITVPAPRHVCAKDTIYHITAVQGTVDNDACQHATGCDCADCKQNKACVPAPSQLQSTASSPNGSQANRSACRVPKTPEPTEPTAQPLHAAYGATHVQHAVHDDMTYVVSVSAATVTQISQGESTPSNQILGTLQPGLNSHHACSCYQPLQLGATNQQECSNCNDGQHDAAQVPPCANGCNVKARQPAAAHTGWNRSTTATQCKQQPAIAAVARQQPDPTTAQCQRVLDTARHLQASAKSCWHTLHSYHSSRPTPPGSHSMPYTRYYSAGKSSGGLLSPTAHSSPDAVVRQLTFLHTGLVTPPHVLGTSLIDAPCITAADLMGTVGTLAEQYDDRMHTASGTQSKRECDAHDLVHQDSCSSQADTTAATKVAVMDTASEQLNESTPQCALLPGAEAGAGAYCNDGDRCTTSFYTGCCSPLSACDITAESPERLSVHINWMALGEAGFAYTTTACG